MTTCIEKFIKYMPLEEVNYTINISLKNKYVFFEVAKNGCSTIKNCLFNLELQSNGFPYHQDGNGYYLFEPNSKQFNNFSLSIHATQPLSPFIKPFQLQDGFLHNLLLDKKIFKFAIVRNPFSRLLSCYLDKIVNHKHLLLFERQQILKILGKNTLDSEYDISFNEFTDAIGTQRPYEMNHHWRTQSSQLFIPLIEYDFIGNFENLQKSMLVINSNIKGASVDFNQKIDHHKTTTCSLLKKYYTPENLNKTIEIYRDDFINFNYPPTID